MINENFINRVIQVLVERRLDEGEVKARNKAKKNAFIASEGEFSKSKHNVTHPSRFSKNYSTGDLSLGRRQSRMSSDNDDFLSAASRSRKNKDKSAARINLGNAKNTNKPKLP